MALRAATDEDYAALFGEPAPGDWFGLVSARPHLIEGMGLAYRDARDRWWLGLMRAPGIGRTGLAHRGARKLMAMADERGVTLHAMCDPRFDGTERWLARLGFAPTAETMGGIVVWTR